MKNFIKYILILVIGGLVFSSCDETSAWDDLTKDYDKNASAFYIQILNATGSYETDLVEGVAQDIETIVGVSLLGPPQSSDIEVTLNVSGESTLTSSMYLLDGTTVTIPAGSSSGSVGVTFLAQEMPENEWLHFIINMEVAGGDMATSGNQLDYAVYRVPWCPLEDLNDMAGTWDGLDDWGNTERMVTTVDADNLMMSGLGKVWLADVWGESSTAEASVVMTMNPDGTLDIEEQYIFTTVWDGAPYDYAIVGSGTWNNCTKIMHIEYDMHNTTDGYYLSDYGYAPIIVDLVMN